IKSSKIRSKVWEVIGWAYFFTRYVSCDRLLMHTFVPVALGEQFPRMRKVADLTDRLQALHQRTAETPLFNPVFQLSLELSRLIEGGELALDDCESLIAELECDALKSRAERLRGLVAPVIPEANRAAFDRALA